MDDATFVGEARRKWNDLVRQQDTLGDSLPLTVALWTALHVDRLLTIAEQGAALETAGLEQIR